MLFPETKRVVFQKNPLAEVICQLQFPSILQIASEDPVSFQNKIRAVYPLYERESGGLPIMEPLPKELSTIIREFQLMGHKESPVHKFTTADSARFISLSPNFLAVTDRDYRRWEQFSTEVMSARAAFEEIYQPAFFTRVGLRYRDIIDKTKLGLNNEPWETLINGSLISLLGAMEIGKRVHQISTTALLKIDEVDGGFLSLRHGLVRRSDDEAAYRIDADFYTEERRNGKDVPTTLNIFNQLAGNLFRWAATSRLQEALEPVAID